jgi:hypothetical protein
MGIFSQETINRVLSPEKLDDYARVATPGAWFAVSAFFIVVASVAVWGFTGRISKTITVNGVVDGENTFICYVGSDVNVGALIGCPVKAADPEGGTFDGTIREISKNPLSAAEIRETQASDWVFSLLVKSDFAYAVQIEFAAAGSYELGTVVSAAIVTEKIKPIQFLLNEDF